MKRFSTILKYLSDQKAICSSVFCFQPAFRFIFPCFPHHAGSLSSTALWKRKRWRANAKLSFSASSVLGLYQIYSRYPDPGAWRLPMHLGAICVIIILSIFFKNFFLYLSYRIMGPMRNRVLTRLSADLYSKILELPLGFFTEQRKGDLISRMSNDINEIEWSVISTLEGCFPRTTDDPGHPGHTGLSQSAVIHFPICAAAAYGIYHRAREPVTPKNNPILHRSNWAPSCPFWMKPLVVSALLKLSMQKICSDQNSSKPIIT